MPRKKPEPRTREAFIARTGRPPRTREEYIAATGAPPDWTSWPEDLRQKIKLNVRLVPSRLAQVRILADYLKITMEEVIVRALDALSREVDAERLEREIVAAARVTKPRGSNS